MTAIEKKSGLLGSSSICIQRYREDREPEGILFPFIYNRTYRTNYLIPVATV